MTVELQYLEDAVRTYGNAVNAFLERLIGQPAHDWRWIEHPKSYVTSIGDRTIRVSRLSPGIDHVQTDRIILSILPNNPSDFPLKLEGERRSSTHDLYDRLSNLYAALEANKNEGLIKTELSLF